MESIKVYCRIRTHRMEEKKLIGISLIVCTWKRIQPLSQSQIQTGHSTWINFSCMYSVYASNWSPRLIVARLWLIKGSSSVCFWCSWEMLYCKVKTNTLYKFINSVVSNMCDNKYIIQKSALEKGEWINCIQRISKYQLKCRYSSSWCFFCFAFSCFYSKLFKWRSKKTKQMGSALVDLALGIVFNLFQLHYAQEIMIMSIKNYLKLKLVISPIFFFCLLASISNFMMGKSIK